MSFHIKEKREMIAFVISAKTKQNKTNPYLTTPEVRLTQD